MRNITDEIFAYLDDVVGPGQVTFLITDTPSSIVKHLFLRAIHDHNFHGKSVRLCALSIYGYLVTANYDLNRSRFGKGN